LKITSIISMAMAFLSFCAPFAVLFISGLMQGSLKSKSMNIEQYPGQTAEFLAKKRMWADIGYTWHTWLPTFRNIAIVLLGISVVCIALYFMKKRKPPLHR